MLLATAYVLLAGSYLEWCMILRARHEVLSAPLTDRNLQTGACNGPSQSDECIAIQRVST